MSSQINPQIHRKLHKRFARESGPNEDFIARLSNETLLKRAQESHSSSVLEDARGLFLYERNPHPSGEFSGITFDQIPFDKIDVDLETLQSMMPAQAYAMLLCNLGFDWVDAGEFIRLLDTLLMPEGDFWFSGYGSLTADTTRTVLAGIGDHGHFNEFYDMRDIGDALLGAGFENVVLESSVTRLEYRSVDALLADAYRVFGVNLNPKRCKGLTSPRRLDEFKRRVDAIIIKEGCYVEQVELLIAHGRKSKRVEMSSEIPVRLG